MHHYKDKLAKDSKKFTLKLFLHKQRIVILIIHHYRDNLSRNNQGIFIKLKFSRAKASKLMKYKKCYQISYPI